MILANGLLGNLIKVPFGYLLDWLYQFTTNYGLSLILFAIIIKLVLLPASIKSKKSTMKMSRISPRVQALQEKYAGDQQKQNEAIQALYKEEGVSMGGGCLWSFLPLFILFPLYAVVRQPITYMLHETVEVAAQVVSGIGFLGAGVILRDGTNVKGLNTAATLWCSAAVGTLIALDFIIEACIGVFYILFSNVFLRFISKKLIKGIRPHEFVILSCLIYNKYFTVSQVENYLSKEYGLENQFKSIKSAINVLSMNFYRKETSDDYQANTVTSFVTKEDWDIENLFFKFDKSIYAALNDNKEYKFEISDTFRKALANSIYLAHIKDAIKYGFYKYVNVYADDNPFKLYEKYSREDVLRLLNWERFMNGQNIGGYKIKYNTCPIFVTYNKKEDISETINYEDHFISKEIFNWMSRNNRKTSSPELGPLINYNGVDAQLFIQKSNDEGIEFYYIGKVVPITYKQVYRNINGKDQPIVNFKFKIQNEVKDELYSYFVND